jgi:hypothetical protein
MTGGWASHEVVVDKHLQLMKGYHPLSNLLLSKRLSGVKAATALVQLNENGFAF